ncbi:MAG: hypothetical protein KatS3mg055_1799 [Chloroflexus sp.]|uniref:DUF4129 domain-containing protein n=1 Tax=Chloroflexus sp. TaxID=1904827 RepID=UPI0021DC39F9|nr:DUF4129 domain-containing protein [Chloroflexus sp.]GIV89281.1 MAG: hypothetical protein KatS3mg055_1799 [Chloroflexus sp.]
MKVHRVLSVLFVLWWAWPALAMAQPTEVSLTEYERLLRAAYAAAQRGDRLELQALADELTIVSHVRMPDGQLASVDQRWLTEALLESEPDLLAVTARLGALIDALPPSTTPPAQALQRWEEVFNEPPFDRNGPGWLEQFFEWLFGLLERLNPPLPEVPIDGPQSDASSNLRPFVWIGIGLAMLIFGGVLFFWIREVRLTTQAPKQQTPTAEADPITCSEAQRLAAAARQAGDRRSAVRYLYLAALLWLDEQGLLHYDRSLTNREYLQQLRDRPSLRDRLAPVVNTFDAVWYGQQVIDEQAFARYEQQVAAIKAITTQMGRAYEATA